jgi:hypothetical protein
MLRLVEGDTAALRFIRRIAVSLSSMPSMLAFLRRSAFMPSIRCCLCPAAWNLVMNVRTRIIKVPRNSFELSKNEVNHAIHS